MNRPCDLEIGLFEEQWQLDEFARSAIEQVPAAILGVVLRTFHVYRNRAAHSDGEFIRHARSRPMPGVTAIRYMLTALRN